MNLLSLPAFPLYAACCGVLIITMYGLAFWTAKTRAARKQVVNPEDIGVNPGSHVAEVEHPDTQRVKRAHINALENAVPFFAIGFLYTLTNPGLMTARILMLTFVGIRLFHALFYLNAKQPFRTLSFAVGAIINIVMVVQVLRAVVPLLM